MRAAELFFTVLVTPLCQPQHVHCFHIPCGLRHRECSGRCMNHENNGFHDPGTYPHQGQHRRPSPPQREVVKESPSPPTSPMTRQEVLSNALLLGTVGAGAILTRPQAVAAQPPIPAPPAEEDWTVPLRPGGDAREEDWGRRAAFPGDGSALLLPAVGVRTKRIFLARHGQTDLNKFGICQGRKLDPPLNENGRHQARTLMAGRELGAIVCSPLRRARETAGIARDSHPLTSRFLVSEDLREVDLGGAEGLPLVLSAAVLAPSYLAWSQGKLDERAGLFGECGTMVARRAEAAAKTLLTLCEEGGQVLGVSHSSMIKFTLATLLDVSLGTIRTLGQDNCAINAIDFDAVSGKFEAVAINGRAMRGRAERFGRGDIE